MNVERKDTIQKLIGARFYAASQLFTCQEVCVLESGKLLILTQGIAGSTLVFPMSCCDFVILTVK